MKGVESPHFCQGNNPLTNYMTVTSPKHSHLGSSDVCFKGSIHWDCSRLLGRAKAMALYEGLQHGLRGHGALQEGGLPEGVLTQGVPG